MHDLLRAYAASQATTHDTEEARREALTRLFDYYLAACATAMDHLARPNATTALASTGDLAMPQFGDWPPPGIGWTPKWPPSWRSPVHRGQGPSWRYTIGLSATLVSDSSGSVRYEGAATHGGTRGTPPAGLVTAAQARKRGILGV